jgi:adenine-specific DNA methylase
MLLKKIQRIDRHDRESFLSSLLDPFNKHAKNRSYLAYLNKNTNIANNTFLVLCPLRGTK